MKFKIDEKEYDAEAGIAKVTLTTLYELKLRHGIGMQTLMEMLQKFEKFQTPMEILEDKHAFQAFRVLIWLARKHAGEKLSLDEANEFPLDTLEIIMPEEDEVAPDPKAAGAPDVSGEESTQVST